MYSVCGWLEGIRETLCINHLAHYVSSYQTVEGFWCQGTIKVVSQVEVAYLKFRLIISFEIMKTDGVIARVAVPCLAHLL